MAIPVLIIICVGPVATPVSVFHIIMNNGVTSTVWWLPECETHTHVRKNCNRLSDKGDFLCFYDLSAPYSSLLFSPKWRQYGSEKSAGFCESNQDLKILPLLNRPPLMLIPLVVSNVRGAFSFLNITFKNSSNMYRWQNQEGKFGELVYWNKLEVTWEKAKVRYQMLLVPILNFFDLKYFI